MGIKFTKRDPSLWETWIPDYADERELARTKPEEAFSVDLKFMTLEERKRHERIAKQVMRGKIPEEESESYLRGLFASHVRNVKNYSDGEREITTGPALLEHLFENGEGDLVYEIVGAIAKRSRLEEGLAKKLHSGSDFKSSHRTPSGNGVAVGAIQQSSQGTPVGLTTEILSYEYQTNSKENNEDATENPRKSCMNGPRA